MKIKLDYYTIYSIVFGILSVSVFIFNSKFFLVLMILLCITELAKGFKAILVFLLFSPFLIYVDLNNFKDYILMFLIVILVSLKFYSREKQFLFYYSIPLFFLIVSSLFVEQLGGDIMRVITLEQRLTPIFDDGDYINPNIIGLIASMCAISFFINSKYIFLIISIFILILTQSRSSILFLITFFLFSTNFDLKKIFYSFFSVFLFTLLIYLSPVWIRFSEGPGESGDERLIRILLHHDTIKNSFPIGYNYEQYLAISEIFGTIDSTYVYLYIRYGLIGILSLILLILFHLLNSKDDFSKYRLAIFLSLLIQGLLESSLYGNYFVWPFLALCFNSFNTKRFLW